MSMITGCPACGTMFKVVADQLRISEGWVRCGHCSEIFDATAHMQSAGAVVVAATAEPGPDSMTGESAAVVAPAPGSASPPAATRQAERPMADGEGSADSPLGEAVDSGYPPMNFLRADAQAATPGELPGETEPKQIDTAALQDISFLRDARHKAFWRRPRVRLALVLVALSLMVVLGLQVVVHERDHLASTQPQWRPWLEQLCEPLGCVIGLPRRIDAILIDQSGFSRLRPDAYRLSFTLKNQTLQPVALPALELTLTDTQDQPVLRRVLTPGDLGAKADALPGAADWSAAVAITLEPSGGSGRIAGYRLLAFYP